MTSFFGMAFRDRMQKCDRTELEQSLVRIVILILVVVYVYVREHGSELVSHKHLLLSGLFSAIAVAVALSVVIFFGGRESVFRRVIGAWLDIGSSTIFMLLTGESGALVIGLYLWVIFGNGFRFGNLYLFHAQILSLAGLFVVSQKNAYWVDHPTLMHVGMVMLIAMPIYVALLIKRLHNASSAAQCASVAKTHFVANMSHEIRTPLNGIVGISELFKATPLNAEQRDLLDTLDSSSKLLMSLLNNVLDFAKIEEGKISINPTEFSAGSLSSEAVRIFHSQAHTKGIGLSSSVDFGIGNFRGDSDLLQQVLANLVGNAIKFTERGSVSLKVSSIPMPAGSSMIDSHQVIRFEVSDTGVGVPLSAQDSIFETFKQASHESSKRFGGSGLGLAIAKRLVEAMGGKISFESAEGVGSRFWFDLALEKCAQQPETYSGPNRRHDASLAILICEDDATNQKIMNKLMRLAGHTVTIAQSGEEMLDQLDHGMFDVVISDLNMPGMGGAEALKLYRFTHADDIRTRFVMLTADATMAARDLAKEAGFDAFLVKPADARTIFSTVANLIGLPSGTANHWLDHTKAAADSFLSEAASVDGYQVLDLHIMRELEILGADDSLFVHGLLHSYLRDSEILIDRIEAALKTKSHDEFLDSCHALKGNSLGVGAKSMFSRAEALYNAEMGEIRFRGPRMIALLRSDYAAARAAIEGYLTQRLVASR